MSVIIKGFKMPSGCAYCDLNNDSKCSALGMLPDEGNGLTRRKECPLEEFPIGDFISRQAAIDAVGKYLKKDGDVITIADVVDAAVAIGMLPSAEPEPLTDKEQRIFLAAMAREEKVCEEVDRNYTREPYEDSLVGICREIERKVKDALWGT